MSVALLLSLAAGAGADGSLTPSPPDVDVGTRSLARYEVVFEGAWNLQTTPGGLPSGAHFTPLIGGVHDDQVVFLRSGERASPGVEDMAELGLTRRLANEVMAAGAVVLHRQGNIDPEETASFDHAVELSTDNPRVTLTTMVAPSPDWFTGVSGLSLLGPDGHWVPSRTVSLYPWDAGTEDGAEFSLSNPATSPQGVISSLRGQGKFTTARIASLSFTLQSVQPVEGGPEITVELVEQTLVAGAQELIDMERHFRDAAGGMLAYSARSSDSEVVSVTVETDRLWLTAVAPGSAMVTVRAVDAEGDGAEQVFPVQVTGAHRVWVFPAANDADGREGFVRTINASAADAVVSVLAIDVLGREYGPATLTVPAGAAVQFNSTDLEDGNPDNIADGVEQGMGSWRLELESAAGIEVRSYLRIRSDGFLTPMTGAAPRIGTVHRVAFFNPASNTEQVSVLRIVNPGPDDATVTIEGLDDAGQAGDAQVQTTVAARRTMEFPAGDLESGAGLTGALGDGEGKWRLTVTSTEPVTVLSLLETSGGHLANLSEVPVRPLGGAPHLVWTFPSASDPFARQGFVRVINHSDVGGDVSLEAIDDVGNTYGPLTLNVDPGAVAAFNSEDLEGGEPEKGLDGSTGPGVGDWRLVLTSELDIEVLPYVRTSDGLVTSMHRVAPSASGRHRVAIFNPASNPNQLSRLRIINPGTEPAAVVIAGIDDDGSRSAASVEADIPPGEVREFRAAAPTRMGVVLVPSGLEDVFGDGQGKWRLDLDSPTPITVVNLLASPTGHLTNLSAARAS